MSMSRGIDVSHHQGSIDWPRITRELGLSWAACKATEGATFRDSQFASNWAQIKAAGLVRVAYHFARPGGDAASQARFFLSVVKPAAGDVLCLDLEQSDGRDQTQVNAWARAFAAALRKAAPGNTTVVYLGGYAANGSGRALADHFDYWWFPRYATMQPVTDWPASYGPRLSGNTTGWKAPHIWQWAASLRTSQGQVDANLSTITAAELRDGPHRTTPTQGDTTMAKLDDDDRKWLTQMVRQAVLENGLSYNNPAVTDKDVYQQIQDISKAVITIRDRVAGPGAA